MTTPRHGAGPTTTVAPGGTVHSCDFEANVCSYTEDKTDNFDWTRNSRGTSTVGTGPPSDHTYGTVNGDVFHADF